jgi:hypothetical protein
MTGNISIVAFSLLNSGSEIDGRSDESVRSNTTNAVRTPVGVRKLGRAG